MESRDLESLTHVLESIALRYPKDSDEHRALRVAAQALLFAYTEEQSRKFDAFLKEFGSDLTKEQKAHLRRMGLAPNTPGGSTSS